MSEDRDVILADFQAVTGIEDVAQAIYLLEETNWNLLQAANKVIPDVSQEFVPSRVQRREHQSNNVVVDVDMLADGAPDIPARPTESALSSSSSSSKTANHTTKSSAHNHHHHRYNNLYTASTAFVPSSSGAPSSSTGRSRNYDPRKIGQASTSNSAAALDNGANSTAAASAMVAAAMEPNMIRFRVRYCSNEHQFALPDTSTIKDIKQVLHAKFKVMPCRQLLSSWARLSQYENTTLREMGLPRDNSLELTVQTNNAGGMAVEDDQVVERMSGTFNLAITSEIKTVPAQYPGTKTIHDVKMDVASWTNIPVRNQIWVGWPPNIDDQTPLSLSGIDFPDHSLSVRAKPSTPTSSSRTRNKHVDIVQIDSDDDFEDASADSFNVDDDYFIDVTTKREEPLVPADVEDEIIGSISFSEQFQSRYALNLSFYQGTLDDAIKDACNKPASERKIMAIYIHHDASVLSNVFCSQLLGFESVQQLLSANFILWGWDLTYESNRRRLEASVNNSLGNIASSRIKTIPANQLPAMIVIMKIRSSTDIFNIITGNVGVNELMSNLLEAVEVFKEHQDVETREERERAEREQVKWEQDLAYNESLQADKAKEEARRMAEEAETQARKYAENQRAEEIAKKEALRKQAEASLPPEPVQEQGDHIAKIRFKLPAGESFERRFLANTPLKILLDYLMVKGFPSSDFKVISSWPRRDLTSVDVTKSLKDLKLYPQETLMLEER